jgi:UDP-N-acetylmuramoylalanine--D-glutamate ligase
VTRWLLKQGALVTVTDLKNAEQLRTTLDALRGEPVTFVLGEHREKDFVETDLIVRNPGVPRESKFLAMAREHHVPVEMEMGLFAEQLPRGMEQVVGITGTKGKTTTTLMVGNILQRANPKTVVAGNLRVSALELLDQIDAETPVVLELSSWQLEAFTPKRISPHVAAVTNIYPDHLNRYRDMDDYASAKAEIFRYQQPGDAVILNLDNLYGRFLDNLYGRFLDGRFMKRPYSGRVVWFSGTRVLREGASVENAHLMMDGRVILDAPELAVPGRHNVENALAAMAIAATWGATDEQIATGLREFRGVLHRLELVRELEGVKYINDTTATAPVATIAALEALAQARGRVVLIAGGADKGLGFDEMARAVVARVTKVTLLEGSATEPLERAIRANGGAEKIAGRFDNLLRAVEHARGLAVPDDIVLLSPGCASFGMFANEFERGDEFRRIVNAL